MLIGHHIGKKELLDGITTNSLKFNSYQFFASSPKTWAMTTTTTNNKKEDTEMIRQWIIDTGTFIIIHGKYLYNFCRTTANQTETLIKELQFASQISDKVDVIIHQGKNLKELGLTRPEAINVFCKNITNILYQTRTINNKIILENSAHQGTEIGYSLDELAEIYNTINSPRIGICIDLCHVFVSGELDMRDAASIKLFFKRFDKLIGLNNLTVIHYNDSNAKFDSHNDRHGDISTGYIGSIKLGGNNDGFAVVAKIAKKYRVPMILETPASIMSYTDQIGIIIGL